MGAFTRAREDTHWIFPKNEARCGHFKMQNEKNKNKNKEKNNNKKPDTMSRIERWWMLGSVTTYNFAMSAM